MHKYEVRLESQTDSQARVLTIEADDETKARNHAERSELDIVNFSLLPPEKGLWEIGGADVPDGDALVNLARWDAYDKQWADWAAQLPYDAAVRAANARLENFASRIHLDEAGKVKGRLVGRRTAARFLAHHQDEPYRIVDVRSVDQAEIDGQRLVMLAKALQHNPERWQWTLDQLREAGIPLGAVTAVLYGLPWQKQIDGSSTSVFSSATVQMSLHSAYTVNQDTHDFFDDASATEVTGTGYTANGYTFANKASTYDTGTDTIRLDNTVDPNWTSSTISATDAVVWVNTAGASSTDPVYGAVDFGATVSTTNGTFTVALDATGWAVFDVT